MLELEALRALFIFVHIQCTDKMTCQSMERIASLLPLAHCDVDRGSISPSTAHYAVARKTQQRNWTFGTGGSRRRVYGQNLLMLYKEIFQLTLCVLTQTHCWLTGSLRMFSLQA